jgi:hypothetical protein
MTPTRREPPRRENRTFTPDEAARAKERLLTRMRQLKELDPQHPDFVERAKMAVDNSTGTVRDVFGETSDEANSFLGVLYDEDSQVTAGGFLDHDYDPRYAERAEFVRGQARITRLAPRLENLLSIVDEKTIGDARVSRAVPTQSRPTSRRVFVVHGHDEAVREAVARTLERLELQPVILHEQPDKGRTIIEKLEAHKEDVGYAVVLMTPDDVGGPKGTAPESLRARARCAVGLLGWPASESGPLCQGDGGYE